MAQPQQEIDFFNDLTLPQLVDLKNFWQQIIFLLYPIEATPNNQHVEESKQKIEEEIKSMIQASNHSKDDYSNQLWDWIMMDDPDQMVLKFIKAKKFKSNLDSLKMLFNSLSFRIQRNLHLIRSENPTIANQLRIGKAFMFGLDKSGCPIFRINAAKHKQQDQTPKELEDFVLYSMEVTRLFIVPPAQHVSLLVDLSGFGMSNMDWKCTNFMISTLEAHYPETLNFQIIHNAPWIFQGLWKAISTLLDPVVRSKILFTSKDEDLSKMIDKKFLFKSQGGQSEFKWGIPTSYPIDTDTNATTSTSTAAKTSQPENSSNINGNQSTQKNNKGELGQLNLTEEENKIKSNELETRQKLIHHFILLTQLWLSVSHRPPSGNNSPTESDHQNILIRILKLRVLIKMILRAHYLKLLKYIQPETIYHYRKILNTQEPGIIRWDNSTSANKDLNGHIVQQATPDANQSDVISVVGVDSARPNLLKLINEKLNDLRPEFVILPADTSANPPVTQNEDNLLLNKIFIEISQLEY